ncbi:Crotonobetainyl-CoA:carnitine CoA-transferase CaiB [Parafrankia irregularis]|uniref:Crotonobetainyl-CoA:carnitine CoA-transferase CaiB n=1 Tax=Parafrankia irregularis TaxID=795642 RepID=A0A0S4QIL6_9ACTN|nr:MULTISPECIES: CoA transferase [Parafrankia]MBE3204043.1 CoA transferase [Parafrankia sp. CH37]CUU55081.1 Crotonobetainyl-CoA:carnitine CoA-transferase CaiB [Parafrankia irregularis]
MAAVMKGVRVLEVAEQTFVPAASALLSDLGAEVIKIEHVERGDAMRGLATTGTAIVPENVHVLLEHSNRGKRSLGLDIASPEGIEILYKLAATSDVFITNKLPRVRKKLKIDLEDIRAHNPDIIYVRGTGQGERGPDADKGSYDGLAFWARAGVALGIMQPEYGHVPFPPGPGFGDSIGAMTIAGGTAMALFHRERTGEATVVDVSLMSSAMWAMGQAIGLSVTLGQGWAPPPSDAPRRNPLVGNYLTKDGRWLALTCLQAGRYWLPFCECVGRPDLATDPRFADFESLMAHSAEATEALRELFAQRTVDEWRAALADFIGQWAVVQDTLEAANDPQSVANGYLQPCETADGFPFSLVASPVQFDEEPAAPGRAPEFNEHGDEILAGLGLDIEEILDLKVRGVVA